MPYFRIHTADIAYITQQPRGLFTAIGKLVEAKTLTQEETAEYWKNREYFEKVLPVPPFYEKGNPDRATTWFKDTPQGKRSLGRPRATGFYGKNPLQAYEGPGLCPASLRGGRRLRSRCIQQRGCSGCVPEGIACPRTPNQKLRRGRHRHFAAVARGHVSAYRRNPAPPATRGILRQDSLLNYF